MMGEFAIKVSPFSGSMEGVLWEGRVRLAEGGGVNLYRSAG